MSYYYDKESAGAADQEGDEAAPETDAARWLGAARQDAQVIAAKTREAAAVTERQARYAHRYVLALDAALNAYQKAIASEPPQRYAP